MTDLSKISGLPIMLTDDFHLQFNEPLKAVEPGVRTLEQMSAVLMDPAAKPTPARSEMYYMYRDIHLPEHEQGIRARNLRYDITVLPPAMIGREFNKTLGHYHPVALGNSLAYPELYEVLEGEALFVIQKVDDSGKDVEDIQAIRAKAGDKVIYPAGFGHIIVNIGSGPLVTSNWVADNFESAYQSIKDRGGMGYYVVAKSDGGFEFVPNTHYEFIAPIKSSNTVDSGFGLAEEEPMYTTATKDLSKLDFLNNPH